jgi:hypothetical protein
MWFGSITDIASEIPVDNYPSLIQTNRNSFRIVRAVDERGNPSGMQHPRLFACSRTIGVTSIWLLFGATEADTDLGPKN